MNEMEAIIERHLVIKEPEEKEKLWEFYDKVFQPLSEETPIGAKNILSWKARALLSQNNMIYKKMAKILLIEDDPDQILLYKSKFELAGHQFLAVKKGKEGINLAKTNSPDLILIDIVLGEADGMRVLEELKKDPETKDIPAVILTNLKKRELAEKAYKLGACDYIVKSEVSLKDTLSRMEKFLQK